VDAAVAVAVAAAAGTTTTMTAASSGAQSDDEALLWRILHAMAASESGLGLGVRQVRSASSSSASAGAMGAHHNATAVPQVAADDASLEANLIRLLLADGTVSSASSSSTSLTIPSSSSSPSNLDAHSASAAAESAMQRIQQLLLIGQRDEACRVAVEQQQWACALLLSSQLQVRRE
jgi:hypothetical protein